MIRLLCIDNKIVYHSTGTSSSGHGLKEGALYSADDQTRIHDNNKKECYFIYELQDLKLCSRFVRLSDNDEAETAEASIEEKMTTS